MSIESMKMALEALEDVFGKEKKDVGAINALRQAIEQAEKQEPFIYVREDNEKPFGGYEHCSEADAGAFPVYTAPVDASDMKQERVDKTAKCKHEPWPSVQCVCGGTIYFKYTPPVSDYHEGWEEGFKAAKREWVGLTDEERSYYLQSAHNVGWWQAAKFVEAKLKEKNCG